LLGRQGQLFLLFGMLSRDPEGRLCLEDGEGTVVLDMEDAVSPRTAIWITVSRRRS
jgi:DNA polymerase epsilon subunit 2